MKNNMRITLIGLLALFISLTSCSQSNVSSKEPSPDTSHEIETEQTEVRYNVRTSAVVRQELSSYIDLSGDVEASVSVDVYSDSAGKLTDIQVEPGSYVRKNQVIAHVDPSKPGMNYTVTPVKAPINGTVTVVNVDPGTTVGLQMSLIRIGQLDKLVITTRVPERFLYMIKQGQNALITTTASPGREYTARVNEISPVVNPVSRTLKVELELTGLSPVKAGMFVGIRLITSTEENALVIPEKALVRQNSETFVYKVAGDTAEKVSVTLGLESEGLLEVLSGLSEGDQVITEGVSLLSNGSLVRVLKDISLITNSGENRS